MSHRCPEVAPIFKGNSPKAMKLEDWGLWPGHVLSYNSASVSVPISRCYFQSPGLEGEKGRG
jgi:hypothetical protein